MKALLSMYTRSSTTRFVCLCLSVLLILLLLSGTPGWTKVAAEEAQTPTTSKQAKTITQAMWDKEKAIEIVEKYFDDTTYGGLYVDDDGKAHVMLTDWDTATLFEGLEVTLHSCQYTRAELDFVHQQVEKLIPEAFKLKGMWIITKENVLGVGLGISREKLESWLKDNSTVDMEWIEELPFRFVCPDEEGYLCAEISALDTSSNETLDDQVVSVESLRSSSDYQTMHLGEKLMMPLGNHLTGGFFAYESEGLGYRLGIVTAGHGYSVNDTVTSLTYGTIGTCSQSYLWPYNPDCAFVPLNEYFNVEQKLYFGNNTYVPTGFDYSCYADEGYCKWGYGDNNSYLTTGICLEPDYWFPGFTHGVAIFSFVSLGGDSGGTITRVLPDGSLHIAGIVRGHYEEDNEYMYAYGEKISYIVDKLQVIPVSQDVIKGDVNNNGSITIADVRLALRHVTGQSYLSPYQSMLADMDCDGVVEQSDADKILAITLES